MSFRPRADPLGSKPDVVTFRPEFAEELFAVDTKASDVPATAVIQTKDTLRIKSVAEAIAKAKAGDLKGRVECPDNSPENSGKPYVHKEPTPTLKPPAKARTGPARPRPRQVPSKNNLSSCTEDSVFESNVASTDIAHTDLTLNPATLYKQLKQRVESIEKKLQVYMKTTVAEGLENVKTRETIKNMEGEFKIMQQMFAAIDKKMDECMKQVEGLDKKTSQMIDDFNNELKKNELTFQEEMSTMEKLFKKQMKEMEERLSKMQDSQISTAGRNYKHIPKNMSKVPKRYQ